MEKKERDRLIYTDHTESTRFTSRTAIICCHRLFPATTTPRKPLHLPVNLLGEVLRDQPLIVRPQLDRVDGVIVLRVEVVRVESLHGCEGFEVFLVREVGVGAFAVPSVEWRDDDDEHEHSGAVEEGEVMEERRRTGRSCGSGSWRDLPRGGSFGL